MFIAAKRLPILTQESGYLIGRWRGQVRGAVRVMGGARGAETGFIDTVGVVHGNLRTMGSVQSAQIGGRHARHHDAAHRPDPGRGGGKEILLADILSEQGKDDDAGGDAAVASERLCLERTRQRRMIGDAPRPCRSACPSAEAASMMSGDRGAVGPSAGSETTIPPRP